MLLGWCQREPTFRSVEGCSHKCYPQFLWLCLGLQHPDKWGLDSDNTYQFLSMIGSETLSYPAVTIGIPINHMVRNNANDVLEVLYYYIHLRSLWTVPISFVLCRCVVIYKISKSPNFSTNIPSALIGNMNL